MMKTHVMLDLETMGNGSNAAIVSIGAVVFNPSNGQLGAEFEEVINLNSAAYYSDIDAPTVTWWLSQGDEARAIFLKETPKSSLKDALLEFNQWLADLGESKDICLWGNGAGFDNVILMNSFKTTRIRPNFIHWNDLDVRTIVRMGRDILGINPKETLVREGVHHSALDDAKFQAQYVSVIWERFTQVQQSCAQAGLVKEVRS
ncbi:3'-5' exonuclease [Vibrio splendidus]